MDIWGNKMCGIVGIVVLKKSSLNGRVFSKGLKTLVSGAERRGKDASGYIFVSKSFTTHEKFPSRLSDYKTSILGKARHLWRLAEIEQTLKNIYHWEGFDSPMRGWRNGDATAPFYNLLYILILGYNENNVLVANLLRSGQLNHNSAVELLSNQQSIDVEGLHSYFELINVEAESYLESLISKNNFKRFFG